MARKAGMGSWGQARVSSELKAATVPGTGGSTQKKVHAGSYVHDQAYNEDQHDLTPWVETPSSSRVEAYRYDFLNRAMQVTWRNGKNQGYIYIDVPYEGYRSFARAASKGKQINRSLNSYEYRLMTPDELQAPSNDERSPLSSRFRA